MRPESERLHDFLTAQLMESHQFTARALTDLQLAVDRVAERSATEADSSSAHAYRALVPVPAGAAVLELVERRTSLGGTLSELGYRVTTLPAHLAAGAPVESGAYEGILALEGAGAGPLLDWITLAAKAGATLVLGREHGDSGDLGGWRISEEWEIPGGHGSKLVTAIKA